MSRWFRVHDDMVDDPKMQRLPPDLFKAMVNLWCLASQNDGALPVAADIAFKLRMTPAKTAETITRLVQAGLIDESEDGFAPHNWNARQFKSDTSNERVAAFRKRQRNGECNVTETVEVTPPETEQRQNTEQISSLRSDSIESDWPKDYREQFWELYPRKVGKKAAVRRIELVRRNNEIPWVALLLAIARIDTKDPQFIPHPATWLTQGRYLDGLSTGPPPPADDAPKGWRPGMPTHEELKRKYAKNEPQRQGGEVLESGAGALPGPQIGRSDQARNGRMVQLGSLFSPPGIQAVGDDAGGAEPDEDRGIHSPGAMA